MKQWVTLPKPDNSISFFETIKAETEKYWEYATLKPDIYGFQIQPGTKWNQGLSERDLKNFEADTGITFPEPLRNFYLTMNGLTKPGINIYGSDGTPPTYRPIFYSYPGDLQLIGEMIAWIWEANSITKVNLELEPEARIFPVYSHRFMLVNMPGGPILSMYGDDIVYYSDSLSKLLVHEFLDNVFNAWHFVPDPGNGPSLSFWWD